MTSPITTQLPPVPSAQIFSDKNGVLTQAAQQWLINLRDKVNQINSILVAISGSGTTLGAFNSLSPLTTTGDLLTYNGGNNARLPIGTTGQVLTVIAGLPGWAPGGGGTLPGTSYASLLCALLEPDAIEVLQKDTFTYTVGTQTKYIIASWATQINATGRSEVRDPHLPMAITNTSYNGSQTGSAAIILNPAIPTYTDPWTTYYTRKNAIDTSDVKTINVVGASQYIPFLPGAYGCIVTQVTCFDLAWVAILIAATYGLNTANEISDSATQRIGNNLCMPISKWVAGEFESSSTGSGSGSLSFILLSSTWSVVPDPLSPTYTFRDDFMENSLNVSTIWTRVQSTTGNVEIDLTYHWCKIFGNGTWGANGLYGQTTYARSALKAFVVDVFGPRGATTGACMVGWSDALGQSYSNFAHGLNFGPSAALSVYENGNNRGVVGSGWTNGGIYRVRITVTSTGAKYEIQGGKEYPNIGGSSWTDITPATTASSTVNMAPGATAFGANSYISDVRIY